MKFVFVLLSLLVLASAALLPPHHSSESIESAESNEFSTHTRPRFTTTTAPRRAKRDIKIWESDRCDADNCNSDCTNRGYPGGHCSSYWFIMRCWCSQK